jgi:flavin reductase (DIM6/NTAB) family NADH-FMN oxidoreductase RutF
MASGKRENKFETTGLTPVRSDLVDAPYVDEFPMILECKVIHTYEIGLHTQFIGEIIDVKVDQAALTEKGLPDMVKVEPFIYGGVIQAYHLIGEKIADAFQIGKKLKNMS